MRKYELRDYQKESLEKIKWALDLPGNDLVVLPTGAGKSLVIAELSSYLDQDILILQPSVEILSQNREKLCEFVDEKDISVYSASFGEKEIKKYTFAMIGSIKEYDYFKHFKIVIIDECHLLNPKKDNSMYSQFFEKIGLPKVIGFTATPYRMFPTYFRKNEELHQSVSIKIISRIQPMFWNRIVYNINSGDLTDRGYLSPLKYYDQKLFLQEEMKLNKGGTDFDLESFDKMIENKKESILKTLERASLKFKHILVFCSSVSQAKFLSEKFDSSEYISSKDTNKKDRARIIDEFKSGKVQIIFNVGVLTTGFDMPGLDCIVLLRPTRSIALYYQMLGRGVRKCEGKEFCQVVDFTDTVAKIGKVESIKLEKIFGKWEITTETANDWHGKELYSFKIEKEK